MGIGWVKGVCVWMGEEVSVRCRGVSVFVGGLDVWV